MFTRVKYDFLFLIFLHHLGEIHTDATSATRYYIFQHESCVHFQSKNEEKR